MALDIAVASFSGSVLVIICGLAYYMDLRHYRQRKATKLSNELN
jgi:hypothetical protein